MKKLVYSVILLMFAFFSAAAQAQEPSNPNAAEISFAKTVHDYGTIYQGGDGACEFKFTNTGKAPLIITNVQASCGCTTPSWTKEEVMPGGSGFIKATYNAAAVGQFNKTITVTANIESGFVQLTIKGEVQNPGAVQQ